jgi:hypothetical protein
MQARFERDNISIEGTMKQSVLGLRREQTFVGVLPTNAERMD